MSGMMVPKFKPGDAVRIIGSGWEAVVIEKCRNRHNGYKIEWTDVKGHRFAKVGGRVNMTPLNLELMAPPAVPE